MHLHYQVGASIELDSSGFCELTVFLSSISELEKPNNSYNDDHHKNTSWLAKNYILLMTIVRTCSLAYVVSF